MWWESVRNCPIYSSANRITAFRHRPHSRISSRSLPSSTSYFCISSAASCSSLDSRSLRLMRDLRDASLFLSRCSRYRMSASLRCSYSDRSRTELTGFGGRPRRLAGFVVEPDASEALSPHTDEVVDEAVLLRKRLELVDDVSSSRLSIVMVGSLRLAGLNRSLSVGPQMVVAELVELLVGAGAGSVKLMTGFSSFGEWMTS